VVGDADDNSRVVPGKGGGGTDWFGEGGDVDAGALVLFAGGRVDSMFLRFRLLSALIKAPLKSKAATMRLLHISRQYLGSILKEWGSLAMIDVRDMSPPYILRPIMSISLVKRPVITITRLDDNVEEEKDASQLKEIIPAIASKPRQAILQALWQEEKKKGDGRPAALTVKELQEKVGGKDVHRHIRILLKARLLLKLRTPDSRWWRRGGRVQVMRNYKSIRFSLEPHTYQRQQR
jgi:DNA-binding transcriptional ArsR family regulator